MLTIEADACHAVSASDDGQIVVILRSAHPLTGEISDCLGFRLSPHQALLLSDQLRRGAADVAAPSHAIGKTADVLNWPGAAPT